MLHEVLTRLKSYIKRAMQVTALILDYARLGRAESGDETVNVHQMLLCSAQLIREVMHPVEMEASLAS